MSSPTQTCQICGRQEVVKQDGRGFPPDIAKRRLVKACKANGCPCSPIYRAGVLIGRPAHGMTSPTAHSTTEADQEDE